MQQAIVHAYCVPPLNVTNPSSGKYAYVVRRIENKRSNIPQHTHTGDYCIRYCAYTTAAIYECIMLLIVLLPKLLCCPHVYIDVQAMQGPLRYRIIWLGMSHQMLLQDENCGGPESIIYTADYLRTRWSYFYSRMFVHVFVFQHPLRASPLFDKRE